VDNFEKYKEFTKAQDWAAICRLNEVALDSFGTKKELSALPEYLEPDEVVFALTSGIMGQTGTSNAVEFGSNTWLVVLTTDRFLFLDCAMLSSSVDTQSVRHERVQAVSASQGFILGKITVDLGSRLLVVDNCQKATVKVIADLANKWLKEIKNTEKAPSAISADLSKTPLMNLLERLTRLAKIGAISEQEFSIAKEKILNAPAFRAEKEQLLSSLPL